MVYLLNKKIVTISTLLYFISSFMFVALAQDSSQVKKWDSLQNLIGKTDSINLKIAYYKSLGKLVSRNEKHKYLECLLAIRDLYKQDENTEKYCDYTQHIGWFYTVKIEALDTAKVFLDEGLKLAEKLNDTMLIGKGLTYTGLMYQRKGYNKLAMAYLLKSLPYKIALGELNRIAFSYNLIGEVYNSQQQYNQGLDYHLKALELRKKIEKNGFHIANSYVNISSSYYGNKQYQLALNYGLEALKIYEKIGTGHNISRSNNLVGKAYLKLNKVDKAIKYFQETVKLHDEIKINFLKIEALSGLADAYLKKKDLIKSEASAKESVSLAEKHSYATIKSESYFILSELKKTSKEYKEALKYYQKHIALKDSITNAQKATQIAEMERLYSIEKKEGEIATLAAKNAKQQQLTEEKKHERNLALIIAIVVVLLSAFLYFFYKKTKHKNKLLALALEDRNLLLKETHHRIKNSFQMVSSLLFLQAENIQDKKAAQAVREGQNRVKSMALIHQKLYQKDNLIGVDTKEYIEELINDVFETYRINKEKINLKTSIDNVALDIENVMAIGLIINELLTNIIKHAFTKESSLNIITITFKDKTDYLELMVSDNGVGFDIETIQEKSFGIKLIKSLGRKLKAETEFLTANGTEVRIKMYNYKKV